MASRRSPVTGAMEGTSSPGGGDTRISIGQSPSANDGAGSGSDTAPLLTGGSAPSATSLAVAAGGAGAPPSSSSGSQPASAPASTILRLGFGVFFFFTLCSLFEELAFKGLGKFKFSWFFTFFELLCISAFSVGDRYVFDASVNGAVFAHRVQLKEHAKVSLWLLIARALTNKSLEYLNIPTQIVFKSMKLLPILLGSTFILKRKHSRLEYVFVLLLALSATVFALADLEAKAVTAPAAATAATKVVDAAQLAPSPSHAESALNAAAAVTSTSPDAAAVAASDSGGTEIGVAIVLLSLLFDALFSNSQEYLLRDLKVSDPELMVHTNLISCAGMFVVAAVTGEIPGSVAYLEVYGARALGCWVGRAAVTYLGVKCWIGLIKAAGNVTANVVATVRKILTITLSFVIFAKPFLPKYVLGLLLFAASFVVDYYDRQIKAAEAKLAKQRSILAADTSATAAAPGTIAVGAVGGSATELLPMPAAQPRN